MISCQLLLTHLKTHSSCIRNSPETEKKRSLQNIIFGISWNYLFESSLFDFRITMENHISVNSHHLSVNLATGKRILQEKHIFQTKNSDERNDLTVTKFEQVLSHVQKISFPHIAASPTVIRVHIQFFICSNSFRRSSLPRWKTELWLTSSILITYSTVWQLTKTA